MLHTFMHIRFAYSNCSRTYDNYDFYGSETIDDDISRSTTKPYDYLSSIARPSSSSYTAQSMQPTEFSIFAHFQSRTRIENVSLLLILFAPLSIAADIDCTYMPYSSTAITTETITPTISPTITPTITTTTTMMTTPSAKITSATTLPTLSNMSSLPTSLPPDSFSWLRNGKYLHTTR